MPDSPRTAFALLKYGISETILADSTKVSKVELEGLQAPHLQRLRVNAADWDENVFVTVDRNSNASRAQLHAEGPPLLRLGLLLVQPLLCPSATEAQTSSSCRNTPSSMHRNP
jgi:hypothetical protein